MTCINLVVISSFVVHSEPNVSLFTDDIEDRQLVTLSDLEVSLVVSGRDLDGASSEFWIDGFVTDNWNQR